MKNILMLYNPYYQKDVIEQHVDVLLNSPLKQVAFGKIRSKLRTAEHPHEEKLESLYGAVSEKNYLQLFLTDYASMYVAKVVAVTDGDFHNSAPTYYKDKSLEVETWFIISDIRRVVHDDFAQVRDRVLANFTTPNFGNHHYAVYGNAYIYPLMVEQDEPLDYFADVEDGFLYSTEMFKSEQRLEMKKYLVDFRFGATTFHTFHPNTQDALIAAELEFHENKNDPLYDFTSVVIKLSKAFEMEVYLFLKVFFEKLMEYNCDLEELGYSVQGRDYTLYDYLSHKPNIGTNTFLLKKYEIKQTIREKVGNAALRYFVQATIPNAIYAVQPIRNESAHGESASLKDCVKLREQIVGIGQNGILSDLVLHRKTV